MGGEKPSADSLILTSLGSPPRGRGKAAVAVRVNVPVRITPAQAGKSDASGLRVKKPRDHPRAGGEKAPAFLGRVCTRGSPPRGRGKGRCHHGVILVNGITPAWAGKRCFFVLCHDCTQDHPRVGGEKDAEGLSPGDVAGSPPRGRGKGAATVQIPRERRITPAQAGKSPASQPWSPPLWMMVIRPRP